jgi:hypothetical protein
VAPVEPIRLLVLAFARAGAKPAFIPTPRSITMKVLTAVKAVPRRVAVLAVVLTAALTGSAYAAIANLTIDRTAALSPGRLHATLTGTVTCTPGNTLSINGRIVQPNNISGYGYSSLVCDGALQRYVIDVANYGQAFNAAKANAQVDAYSCDSVSCESKYVDAIIRLTK